MKLEQYATMRGMQSAHISTNQQFLDHMLNDAENGPKLREEILTKRIQFDTLPQLFADLESICSLLECSKREFLQMAVSEAIERAQAIYMASYKDVSGNDFMDVHGVKE